MSSPPRTPQAPHRRQRSSISSQNGTYAPSYSRRSSAAGGYSPLTPRSSHGNSLAQELPEGLQSPTRGAASGVGNLADELGEAWDSEGEGDSYASLEGPLLNGVETDAGDEEQTSAGNGHPTSPRSPRARRQSQGLDSSRRGDKRRSDGSEYGDEGFSPGLEARLATVEGLARRGDEQSGSDADGVFERTTEALRELGSQAGIEAGATR